MATFYNVGVQRRRIARERERWLWAVLIVTAIAGVSAAVRFWPAPVPPQIPRQLASRALLLIDPPVHAMPARAPLHEPERPEPAVSLPAPAAVPAAEDVFAPAPDVGVEPPAAAPAPPPVASLLASRRLDPPLDAPVLVYRPEPVIVFADDEPHALMELPAVAVTRVVTVAGRGIRSGVRATTAVLRAAF